MSDSEDDLSAALRAGVRGYLLAGCRRFAQTHRNALRRKRHELGARLRRGDHGFGIILGPSQRRKDESCYAKRSN